MNIFFQDSYCVKPGIFLFVFLSFFFTHMHTHKRTNSLEMFHFSAGKNNLPKHQWCMRSLSCIRTHSTHTRNCKESVFVYSNVSRHIHSHMHCRCLHSHTDTHTHAHTKFESQQGRSQQRAGYCQMVCVMCVITALVFLICDVALRVLLHVCLSLRICVGD